MTSRFQNRTFGQGPTPPSGKGIADATPTRPFHFPKPKRSPMVQLLADAFKAVRSVVFSFETFAFILFVVSIGLTLAFVGDTAAFLAAGGLIYMKASGRARLDVFTHIMYGKKQKDEPE